MTDIQIYLDGLVAEACEKLCFTYQRQRYIDLGEQSLLLAQRSIVEINRYLSGRALRLRESSRTSHKINPEELYVISRGDKDEDSFECAYMYGLTYYEPPLILPTASQMGEMWEYLFLLPQNKQWLTFQDFFEKKIAEVISALHQYEDTLDQEVTPISYVLMSPQGVFVHNALYTLAREVLCGLRQQVSLFKKGGVPVFMQLDLVKKLQIAKKTLRILENLKPRNT